MTGQGVPQQPVSVPLQAGARGVPLDANQAPVGKPRNRRLRLILAITAGVMALLCLGGVGIVVALYDDATKIDRAAPDQVTSSFLRAYLVDRKEQEAALYTCKDGLNLDSIAALRTEMIDREKRFGTTVTAVWDSLRVSTTADGKATVGVDLVITGSASGQQISSRTESWSFNLVEENGWRVCSAKKAT